MFSPGHWQISLDPLRYYLFKLISLNLTLLLLPYLREWKRIESEEGLLILQEESRYLNQNSPREEISLV